MANPQERIRRLVRSLQAARLTDEEKTERMEKTQAAARKEGRQVRNEKVPPSRSS